MRNLFGKTYAAFAILILVSLTFASSVFLTQISRYSVQQQRSKLETTVDNISDFIRVNDDAIEDEEGTAIVEMYLRQMAATSDCRLIITDKDGNMLLDVVDEDLEDDKTAAIDGAYKLNEALIRQLNRNGKFFELGNLSGLFSDNFYITGKLCKDSEGKTQALIIAACPAGSTMNLMKGIMQSYVIIVFFTLVLTLIISWFVSDVLTRPLKGMVTAVKQFTRGDFSARVTEDNNCEEVDELAKAFNNMIITLQQQEELSRGFVANVSHELKTPMTSISGFADGMLDGTIAPDKYRQYLEIISQESHRLSRMVVRMLDTAKLESGEMVITPMPFDLSDIAIQVLLSFENQLEDKKLEVDVDLKDFLIVNGDRDLIYRVVYNLVDNAVKFAEDQGELFMQSSVQGDMAQFTIRNSGSEIPANDLPHVFDRFYKVDRSRSKDKTGAGLGLYFVKTIVVLHGGDISVRSSANETEFSFTIPLAPKPSGNNGNVPEYTQN